MMQQFLLENLFWVFLACASASGLLWSVVRAGQAALSPQKAILAVSREKGVFLDVRSTAEYAAGHIVNAQSAPADELQNKLTALAQYKSRPVVVVCANGMRGRAAVQQLEKAGFAKARLLAGGMAAWRDERLPVAAAKR